MNEYTIKVFWDGPKEDEPGCWLAENDDVPIVTSEHTLGALVKRVLITVPDVLDANGKNPNAKLRFEIDPLPVVPLEMPDPETLESFLLSETDESAIPAKTAA